jgi:hypothetical protein
MIRMPEPVAETDDAITFRKRDVTRLADAIEDLEARAAFAATRGEEALPAGIVRRLCAGESPVRVFRQHRGLRAVDLARRAGIGASYLSEIEAGRKPGSIRALRGLAEALAVELDDLVV